MQTPGSSGLEGQSVTGRPLCWKPAILLASSLEPAAPAMVCMLVLGGLMLSPLGAERSARFRVCLVWVARNERPARDLLSTFPAMDPDNEPTPETVELARHILRSIYLVTEGRPMAACRLSSIPGATTAGVMYALRIHWIEVKGNFSVCLTDEGRRLAVKQAN